MSKQFVQNKYHAGDIVYAKVNPTLELVTLASLDNVVKPASPNRTED